MADPKESAYKPATMSSGDEPVSESAEIEKSETLEEAVSKSRNNNFVISSEFETSADPIRESLKKYWYDYGSDIKFLRIPYSSFLTINEIFESRATEAGGLVLALQEINRFIPTKQDGLGESGGAATSQDQLMSMKEELFDTLNEFTSTDSPVEIYNFNCNRPIEYPSNVDVVGNMGSPKMEISFVYDYELINYEKLLADSSVEEASLLNYYKDYDTIKSAYTFASEFSPTGGPKGGPSITYSKDSKSNFDNEMTKKTRESTRLDTNIIITTSEIENIDSLNEDLKNEKISLPFHIKIDIGMSPQAGSLNREIKKQITQKGSNMFNKVAEYAIDLTSPGANPEYFSKRDFNYSYYIPQYKNEEQTEFELNKSISSENCFLIDGLYMVKNIDNSSVIVNSNSPEITILGETDTEAPIKDLEDEIVDLLTSEKLQNKYMDIVNGLADFYETDVIFYKISKYDSGDLENPLQNIYIPNIDGRSQTYLDFQVKYGKRYVYRISAFKFVSGTEYLLSITEPIDGSTFFEQIDTYRKRKDTIIIKTDYKPTSTGKTQTYLSGYELSLNLLIRDLNEVVISEGSEKISPTPEDITSSTKKSSLGLRATIKALQEYGSTSKSVNAGTYLSNTVAPEINSILGVGSTSDAKLSDEIRTDLTSIVTTITGYTDKAEQLLKDLEGILGSGDGFGTDKATRKKAAGDYISRIQELQELEGDILDGLAKIKDSQVDDDPDDFNPNAKDVNSLTYPVVKMIEIPYYEDAGAILDSPPLFPDVNFIPYKGVSNNISFFLNSGIGEMIDNPIILDPAELEFYNLYRESKKYNDFEPIEFKSDEVSNLAASFEIYRLREAPKSYNDFRNALYQTITESFKGGISKLSSASFLEKIKPNRTYYYMFRQRDARGVVSNPSAVFSVLLVDEGGMVFPIISKYEFPEEKKIYSTSAKKLINIAPSINQVTPQGLSGGDEYTTYKPGSNINSLMGVEKEGMFGKSFKIRVTSKKTGKKIDINLTFDTEVV